jgi:hypothetical protein
MALPFFLQENRKYAKLKKKGSVKAKKMGGGDGGLLSKKITTIVNKLNKR